METKLKVFQVPDARNQAIMGNHARRSGDNEVNQVENAQWLTDNILCFSTKEGLQFYDTKRRCILTDSNIANTSFYSPFYYKVSSVRNNQANLLVY